MILRLKNQREEIQNELNQLSDEIQALCMKLAQQINFSIEIYHEIIQKEQQEKILMDKFEFVHRQYVDGVVQWYRYCFGLCCNYVICRLSDEKDRIMEVLRRSHRGDEVLNDVEQVWDLGAGEVKYDLDLNGNLVLIGEGSSGIYFFFFY